MGRSGKATSPNSATPAGQPPAGPRLRPEPHWPVCSDVLAPVARKVPEQAAAPFEVKYEPYVPRSRPPLTSRQLVDHCIIQLSVYSGFSALTRTEKTSYAVVSLFMVLLLILRHFWALGL